MVEDQPDILKQLKNRLKANGYEVLIAEDGQQGVEIANTQMPDLIITDLALPKITGNVIVRILKKSEKHRHIPIIMLSAFIREGEGAGVEVPADLYIRKPFNSEELIAGVKLLLQRRLA